MKTRAVLLSAVLLALLSVLSYAQAPVPFINLPLVPDATAPGGADFTLTVNGTGFVSNSVVNWNGSPLATQFVSRSQLTATVPAADIATANTGSITVVSSVSGGGQSNVLFFTVAAANPGTVPAFGPPSSQVTSNATVTMAMGDFNGDGKLDLAVVNNCYDLPGCDVNWAGSVSILLGDGAGNFTPFSSVSTGHWSAPAGIAVGDFNRDGKLDLAIPGSREVNILLGDGNGNFTLGSRPGTSEYGATAAAVGDFNGDGKLDLAVASTFAVSILLGDGAGNFTLAWSMTLGQRLMWIAVGDFNGDGKLDVAVADWGAGNVTILLGDGTGNFNLGSSPPVAGYGDSVIVGDVNGDGNLDLIVATEDLLISVLLGDGAGNFTASSFEPTNDAFYSPVLADFNADNKLDLAVAGFYFSDAFILLGDGAGSFNMASFSKTGGANPDPILVGDFNGDGRLDVVALNLGGSSLTISVLLGVPPYPIATISPTNVNFGTQMVLSTSNPQPVTLSNTGSAPLMIGKITAGANFAQTNNCPSKLPPSGSCTINVTFTPRNVGTISGTISITDNAADSPQTVPLTGVGIAVTLLPPGLDFGNQVVGSASQPQIVTLTNYAPKAVTIYGVGIHGNTSFAQTNTCGNSLPAGQSCTISVTFTPQTTGAKTATLAVNDNGGASPQTVALNGNGVPDYPIVTLSPTSLTFATQLVATTSSPQYVTLSNTGYVPLGISSIVANGNFAQTNTCGSSLEAGQSCTITVTFDPQQINQNKGRIAITDNAPNSPQTIPLTGTGTAVTLLPSSLDFGSQPVGTNSSPQIITLTNYAPTAVTISGGDFTGNNPGSFPVPNTTCAKHLPAGGSCTISISFKPRNQGQKTATFNLNDNGGGSPQTVSLSGTGTQ